MRVVVKNRFSRCSSHADPFGSGSSEGASSTMKNPKNSVVYLPLQYGIFTKSLGGGLNLIVGVSRVFHPISVTLPGSSNRVWDPQWFFQRCQRIHQVTTRRWSWSFSLPRTGRTPLLAAVRNGRLDLVQTLCAFGDLSGLFFNDLCRRSAL